MSRNSAITCEEQVPNLTGLGVFPRGHAPKFRIVERPVLDFVDDVRPSPAGVDLVQQSSRTAVQPRSGGLFGLQIVAFAAGPTLEGIVMPRTACEVFIEV